MPTNVMLVVISETCQVAVVNTPCADKSTLELRLK